MTVERIRHIGIVVSNLAKSEKAFKDLFGAKTITPIINNRGKYIDKLVGLRNVYSKEYMQEVGINYVSVGRN